MESTFLINHTAPPTGQKVGRKDDMNDEKIKELAESIYNDMAPWERADGDLDEIIQTLVNDPLEVVKYLVDRFIEN